jgi:signal transduction histidine kinase
MAACVVRKAGKWRELLRIFAQREEFHRPAPRVRMSGNLPAGKSLAISPPGGGECGGEVCRIALYSPAMPEHVADAMKRYLAFTAGEEAHLKELGPLLAGAIPRVVERFYEVIEHDAEAMKHFSGPEQLARQRQVLQTWLTGLFAGDYSLEHFAAAQRIGETHLNIALPQHYMISAMDVLRRELEEAVRSLKRPDEPAKIAALSKLLALELGAMLEAYKTQYAARIRFSEREAMEERLTRAEHLAHLGQLAASLAHAIKNPLAGISGAIQIIRGSLPPASPHRNIIDEMLAQIDRLDATVKDLLVYARPRQPARISVDINELVARVLNVLREEPALRRIRVRHIRENELPRIQADERHLEQVIMNLLLNAADASSEGGRVTITTRYDGCIHLEIVDNGIGMTPEVLSRAFEPFHTTKTKGTGLGLSICKQIVDAHGGRIHIRSKRHAGTIVTVELPVDAPQSATPHGQSA